MHLLTNPIWFAIISIFGLCSVHDDEEEEEREREQFFNIIRFAWFFASFFSSLSKLCKGINDAVIWNKSNTNMCQEPKTIQISTKTIPTLDYSLSKAYVQRRWCEGLTSTAFHWEKSQEKKRLEIAFLVSGSIMEKSEKKEVDVNKMREKL